MTPHTDRRLAKKPRRTDDRNVCALHALLQEETKGHRQIVWDKIEEKASGGEVKALAKLIAILVSVCCLIVAGQAVWLKSDIGKVEKAIADGFAATHRRITEATNERIANDVLQNQQLNEIGKEIGVMNYRIKLIEETIKKK